MNSTPRKAMAASVAHGLAHEVAALSEAKDRLKACCPSAGKTLQRMIEDRRARVAALGAEVAGHA